MARSNTCAIAIKFFLHVSIHVVHPYTGWNDKIVALEKMT